MDCRRAKGDEDEEEDGEMRVCSATIKTWIPYVYPFYTLVNSPSSIKTGLDWFFKPRKALKMVLACVLLGCFQNFCWIPIMNHYRGS